MMRSIVLYAVGSPLTVEVEETCRRLGVTIAGAVKNVPGEYFLLDASLLRDLGEVDVALRDIPCIVPLFTPDNRDKAAREALAQGFRLAPALVDPTAIVASTARFGSGSYVNAGAVIGAAARIGENVLINRSCSIGHHVEIHSLASIGPGAVLAGQAKIGPRAMIGAGAIVLSKIEIGAECVIGAGAVVTKDIPARSTVVGNPAKVIREGPAVRSKI